MSPPWSNPCWAATRDAASLCRGAASSVCRRPRERRDVRRRGGPQRALPGRSRPRRGARRVVCAGRPPLRGRPRWRGAARRRSVVVSRHRQGAPRAAGVVWPGGVEGGDAHVHGVGRCPAVCARVYEGGSHPGDAGRCGVVGTDGLGRRCCFGDLRRMPEPLVKGASTSVRSVRSLRRGRPGGFGPVKGRTAKTPVRVLRFRFRGFPVKESRTAETPKIRS
jgi:hypothetical protein